MSMALWIGVPMTKPGFCIPPHYFLCCLPFFFFLFFLHLIPFKTVTNNSKCFVLLLLFYLCALQLLCCICFHSYRINKRFVTLQSFGNQKLHLRSEMIVVVSWCFCTVASLFFSFNSFFFHFPISNLNICSHAFGFYTGCQQAISSGIQLLWINIKLCSLGILAAGSITTAGSSLSNKKKKKRKKERLKGTLWTSRVWKTQTETKLHKYP